MKTPIALFTGKETALSLGVTQPRFARAVRNRRIVPDFVTQAVDLFRPSTVRRLAAKPLAL